ncbi:hypothetical protein SLH47_23330 [Cognatiyoonia sp. IB215182]|nr:hypothetical protein [Cognatiyoonia sp. IB215182]
MTAESQLTFESRTATPADDPYTATIQRSNAIHPIILAGLPAYQSVVFTMPLDARPTSGYLQINATSQVLDGVEGALRVSIDNVKRGEVLLLPGKAARSLQIPLSPTDFARDELVVSISLQGEGPDSQCSRDEGLEAIVEIETTSAIFVTLDRPLETARDRVNAWGRIVRVAWPHWLDNQERVRRLVLATEFKQHDVETVVLGGPSTDALTTVQLRAVLPMFTEQADQRPVSWPRPLAQKGANAGLRRFHRETSWRYRYDLYREDGLMLPSGLDLDMAFGRQLPGTHWSLTVTLNNRLLHHEILDGSQASYAALIPLPADMQTASNTIEIVASTTHGSSGRCDRGPALMAEMLPTTRLLAGDASYSDPLIEVRQALSEIGVLGLGVSGVLGAADANAASSLLAQLVPTSATLKPDTTRAKIVVVPPQSAGFALPETGPIWLVTQDAITRRPQIDLLEPGTQLPRSGLAILIVPDTIDMTQIAL